MILKDLYKKDITREVNPAVSAGDLDPKTVETEIEEYVFTDETVQGIYDVVSGIKEAGSSHNGIWVNGYFGSGKSHFIKFLDYCLNDRYGDRAMDRLLEQVSKSTEDISNVTPGDVRDLKIWLKDAPVDTILFNIGTVHNSNSTSKNTFVEVFWNEFNKFRGYNQFNLSLAQFLEKPLDEAGVFDDFKAALKAMNFDWATRAQDLAQLRLRLILDEAKKLLPDLDTEAVRQRIIKNDYNISVESFKNEISQFMAGKDKNYRLIFFVDEVSAFIDNNRGLLLQLQEIATGLHDASGGKVWIVCTAQQAITEIVAASQISEVSDDYGKIMGRFTIRVSLGKTPPAYITKVRLLEKNGSGEMELGRLYTDKKTALETQFHLPTGYDAFGTKEEFTDYYPFVPYQFRLITQVLDNFVELQYVDKQKKGAARSIIDITHNAAKNSMNESTGALVPFDQFYNASFEGSLTIVGQQAISNALEAIKAYPKDKAFGLRVVNALFMICHMAEPDKVVFPATIDNIVNLMMTKVDDDIRPLKEKIEDVISFLEDENIIRKEKTERGLEYFDFYTAAERDVARLISSQYVDDVTFADVVKDIIEDYVGNIAPRQTFYSRNATFGLKISGRQYLVTNNPDVWIEFKLESDQDENTTALQNEAKQLIFYMEKVFRDSPIREDLYNYCKTQKYLNGNISGNADMIKANDDFRSRAAATLKTIKDGFKAVLDNAIVISGTTIERGFTNKGRDRFQNAVTKHLENLYPYANFGSGTGIPSTNNELATAIRRPAEDPELLPEMTYPEERVNEYLDRMSMTTRDVPKIVANFEATPYGWSKVTTIFFLNELVRRRKWAFSYNNVKNVPAANVANTIMTETSKYTMESADVIPSELVRQFTQAWDDIFGNPGTSHSSDAFAVFEKAKNILAGKPSERGAIAINQDLYHQIETYPFKQPLYDLIEIQNNWNSIRDVATFFKQVITDRDTAKALFDKRKQISQFFEMNVKNRGGYVQVLEFVRANENNFSHLKDQAKADADELKKILSDEWPVDSMRAYGKLRNSVSSAIGAIRQEYIGKIRKAYEEAYETLKTVAEEQGVPVSTIRPVESEITVKTTTESLDRLQINANADAYLNDNLAKIAAEKARLVAQQPQPAVPGSGSAAGATGTSTHHSARKLVTVQLRTRTTSSLKTEADVDNYLADLKQQIMANIADDKEVMIIK